MNNILDENYEEVQSNTRIVSFVKRFDILQLMKTVGFKKEQGVKLIDIFVFLITLVFNHKNLFEYLRSLNVSVEFKKDVVYDFLNNPMLNWRRFLLAVSSNIIKFLISLTNENRVCAIIIDDSAYYRDRSEKVELLARNKDHSTGKYYKGFRKLTAGWTDGATFIPLAFSLLSSSKPEKILYDQGPEVPKNSPGKARREEAVRKGTDVTLELIDQILDYVQNFQYVLFDSWFSWPAIIKGIKERNRDTICMLKDVPNIFYTYKGKKYRLSDLYAKLNKSTKKSGCIASVIVDYYGISARIVFVRNRNKDSKREWLAILSTNITITEEEIIRIYGMRWDIECYFKVCKSYLRLAKEFQGRSYDSMVAHTTIVSIRYIILSVAIREQNDSRAHGGMFHLFCDEIKDVDFQEAFNLIINLFVDVLRENLFLTKEMIDKILDDFMKKLPDFIKNRLIKASA